MKTIYAALVAGIIGLATFTPAGAQNANPSPAALALAKQIVTAKHIDDIYKNAVPGLVERNKLVLLQSNLNYQKDLNEVAINVAKELAGREQVIGDEIAKIYASRFTEQELKDLLAFYQSPLGKKAITEEPQVFIASREFMEQWAQTFSEEINGKFRAEMRARGKAI